MTSTARRAAVLVALRVNGMCCVCGAARYKHVTQQYRKDVESAAALLCLWHMPMTAANTRSPLPSPAAVGEHHHVPACALP